VQRAFPLHSIPPEDADCLVLTIIPSLCAVEQPRIARPLVACLNPMLQLPGACGELLDEVIGRLHGHWAAGQETQVVSMVRCLKLAFKASLRVDHHTPAGRAVVAILEPRLQQSMITAFELLDMCTEAQFHTVRKLLSGVIVFGVHACQLQYIVQQPSLFASWLKTLLDVCQEPFSEQLSDEGQQCLWKSKRRCCDTVRALLGLDNDSFGDAHASAVARHDLHNAYGQERDPSAYPCLTPRQLILHARWRVTLKPTTCLH